MKSKLYMVLCAALILSAHIKSFSQANTTLSNLTSPTAVNYDLLPGINNARNLGSALRNWKILYIDSIYLKDSLFINNKGTQNTFVGQRAGYELSSGINNAGYGFHALYNNTSGNNNNAFGGFALANNTTGSDNTAFGYRALYINTSGIANVATGRYALYKNARGGYNSAYGFQALYQNTNGGNNTATGSYALYYNTSASGNTATGSYALYHNTTGGTFDFKNTATGVDALYSNTTASGNTATGDEALYYNTTGSNNTADGARALNDNSTGSNNTGLGVYSSVYNNVNNATAIGYNAQVDVSNRVRIGNTDVTSIGGQVGWTSFSDGRYKKNIRQDVQGLAFINSLQPITYTVDIDGLDAYYDKGRKQDSNYEKMKADMKASADMASKIIYNGFIAQEVEKAAAKLNYNFSGVDKPQNKDGLYGLRYSDFVVPLVKAVQELSKLNDVKDSAIKQQQQVNANLQEQINELKNMIANLSTANDQQSTVLSSASLAQNIPNPFANSTSISYTLPQAYNSANIILTDKKGVVLKQVRLNVKGKGSLTVDASTLAAGAYQYSLYVNNKLIDTKQMVLTK